MNPASPLFKTFSFQVGNYTVTPAVWQAVAVVFLLFLLVITMASVRRHFLEWTVRGAGMGVLLGFLLALIIEGLFLLGGRTVLTEAFAWKNAPKPISVALDAGRNRMREVLGDSTEVPISHASDIQSLIDELPEEELQNLRAQICEP